MGDRLLRLRHDAVVGGDDEDGDVGHLRAAGAHRGERLVARRVEEGDLAAVDVHLVRADVLRDAAGLGGDDTRIADRVEKSRLAVIDMAHDRHDRRARLKRLLRVVERLRLRLLVGGVLDRHLAVELGCDELDLLVTQRLGRRAHLAEAHQDLDELRHRDAERLGEVADTDARLDGDGTGRRRRRRTRLATHAVLARQALLARGRTLRALVDDDAPAPSCSAAAATRAERTIRFASVSHVLLQCKDHLEQGRFGRAVSGHARTVGAPPPARSTRCRGRCTRRGPAPSDSRRARRRGPRTGSGHAAECARRSRRTSATVRILRLLLGGDLGNFDLGLHALGLRLFVL